MDQLEHQLELRKIRIVHFYEEARQTERAVIEFALAGIKGLLLANGGALVALLTFIANTNLTTDSPSKLWWSFACFACGITAVLGAILGSYISQGIVSMQSSAIADVMFFHSINEKSIAEQEEQKETNARRQATLVRVIAIACAILSVVFFIAGIGIGLFYFL